MADAEYKHGGPPAEALDVNRTADSTTAPVSSTSSPDRLHLATGLAWWIAGVITDVPDPVLARLTAIVVVQVSVRASVKSALQRSAAVIVGVLLAVAIGRVPKHCGAGVDEPFAAPALGPVSGPPHIPTFASAALSGDPGRGGLGYPDAVIGYPGLTVARFRLGDR